MMFMPDAIKATIDIMNADSSRLSLHSSYNVAGICFDPKTLAAEIKKHIPDFEITYKPDFRQAIADSWPACIDDSVAKKDWGLSYEYDLAGLTRVMLQEVKKKLQ
jgi:nucleoside-diphosphate-sugar epimerase